MPDLRGFVLLWFVSSGLAAQAPLTVRDSMRLAVLTAPSLALQLRSSVGADSSNAVCVELVSDGVDGVFLRTIDSVLHATTGGALVAPLSRSPLRSIAVSVGVGGDNAWVFVRTSGGGLRIGEMSWSHSGTSTYVRADTTWKPSGLGTGMVGDGFVRMNAPAPHLPPTC